MKDPRKDQPALSDMLLKLRFAEKKHGFLVFFRHEVPILAGCQAVGSLRGGVFEENSAQTSQSDSLLGP